MDAFVISSSHRSHVDRNIIKCKIIVLGRTTVSRNFGIDELRTTNSQYLEPWFVVRQAKPSWFNKNKMIPIKPIGRFFPQADDGSILNDTSINCISPHWLPIINKIKDSYLLHFKKQVHSIYLRGSIPRGTQVDGFSDIDVFALLHDYKGRWEMANWQSELKEELQKEYSFVKGVEIMMSQYFNDFYKKNQRLAMIIKTQSLCIYGTDLGEVIPPFYPNKKMILNLTWLSEDVNIFLQKEKISKEGCQQITKVILRSGFELVMEKEGKSTTDLYLGYQVFSKYFPNKEKEMREMLRIYLNPTTDFTYLSKKIEVLGKWMMQQI